MGYTYKAQSQIHMHTHTQDNTHTHTQDKPECFRQHSLLCVHNKEDSNELEIKQYTCAI